MCSTLGRRKGATSIRSFSKGSQCNNFEIVPTPLRGYEPCALWGPLRLVGYVFVFLNEVRL